MRTLRLATRFCSLRLPVHARRLPALAPSRSLSTWLPPSAGGVPGTSGASAYSQFDPEDEALLDAFSEHEGPQRPSSKYTVRELVDVLVLGHGGEVTVLDIRSLTGKPAVDWLIFATARSKTHMRTLARSVTAVLKAKGVLMYGHPPSIEGADAEDWMLVDAGKAVISVFPYESRRSLNLEEHWLECGAVTALQMPRSTTSNAAAMAAAAAAAAAGGDLGDDYDDPSADSIYREKPDMADDFELIRGGAVGGEVVDEPWEEYYDERGSEYTMDEYSEGDDEKPPGQLGRVVDEQGRDVGEGEYEYADEYENAEYGYEEGSYGDDSSSGDDESSSSDDGSYGYDDSTDDYSYEDDYSNEDAGKDAPPGKDGGKGGGGAPPSKAPPRR